MPTYLIKILCISIPLIFFNAEALAGSMSAETLYGYCKHYQDLKDLKDLKDKKFTDPTAHLKFSFCTGYISGILDGYILNEKFNQKRYDCPAKYLPPICLPDKEKGIVNETLIQNFIKYMETNKPGKEATARGEVMLSIHLSYPCLPKESKKLGV